MHVLWSNQKQTLYIDPQLSSAINYSNSISATHTLLSWTTPTSYTDRALLFYDLPPPLLKDQQWQCSEPLNLECMHFCQSHWVMRTTSSWRNLIKLKIMQYLEATEEWRFTTTNHGWILAIDLNYCSNWSQILIHLKSALCFKMTKMWYYNHDF